MHCSMEILDQVVDRFGEGIEIKTGKKYYTVTVPVSLSTTFYAWVFQYAGKMSIVSPEYMREAYVGYLEKALGDIPGDKGNGNGDCCMAETDLECSLLWAKSDPYKQLLPHMIDAGYCAHAYLNSPASSALLTFLSEQWDCSPEEAVAFTAYLVAMHDIGKATPQFQMQNEKELQRLKGTVIKTILPEAKLKPVRHEYLSRSIASRIWKGRGENKRIYDAYACILSLHHQKPDKSDPRKPAVHEGWQLIQNELEIAVRNTFHFSGRLLLPKFTDPVCILLTGILILCDWVASSGYFDKLPDYYVGYAEKSKELAYNAVKQFGLTENHRIHVNESFRSLWPQIASPRDIQAKCELADPAAPLTIIEAPMGEGKTEAALYVATRNAKASGKRGIYVALPTQATSNQMFGRFEDMLEHADGGHARLLHGMAFLTAEGRKTVQSEDAPEAERWLGTSRMGLLDENGVGTVDQAMGSVLLARFGVLRLLGLANKVLIIDELHAYDAYMSEIIGSLLRWCRSLSIPVVLLSATLQNSQRQRYLSCYVEPDRLPALSENYPLITQVKSDQSIVQIEACASMQTDYEFKPVRIGQSEEQVAHFALEQVINGGCYCVLANTVKRAQKIYQCLVGSKDPDTEAMLFHARYMLGKRNEIEKECLQRFGKGEEAERPAKMVLVATQVVEQSLDIDFDGMVSELAPVDLLLQRAGRVHRHRNRIRPSGLDKPVVHVVLPGEDALGDPEKRYGSSGYVYAPFLLYNTEKLLEHGTIIRVPQDVRSAIAQVYEQVSEENLKAWQQRTFNQQLMAANADHVAFPPPAINYFFPAQTHSEFEDLSIDDGFDPAARAATRIGDPTFRIAFVDTGLLDAARSGSLSKSMQKEILLSSVSLRMTPDIRAGLSSGDIFQIRKGALWGCYVTDQTDAVNIGDKKLINDATVGVYWEE